MSRHPRDSRLTRRTFIGRSALVPAAVLLASCGDDDPDQPTGRPAQDAGGAPARELPPTPACDEGGDPTPQQTEGPFFKPDSPRRRSLLEPGIDGDRLLLSGTVLTSSCRPIPRALLDFWQADDAGEYDNQGNRLRGHQFADARGRFRLETVVPGLYIGRTRHIHVKVQRPRGQVLTTQLYFPGEQGNAGDGLFQEELLMELRRAGDRRLGRFDFVLGG